MMNVDSRGWFQNNKTGEVKQCGREVYWKEWKLYSRKMAESGWREMFPELSDEDERTVNQFKNQKINTMKTSKVKSVQACGTWDSKFGTMYKFEYLFEDGQVVNANHKTADGAFAVGTLLEYEITNAEYNNGKVSKPQDVHQGGQGSTKSYVDNTKGIKIGHALTNGVNIFLSNGSYEAMNMKESIKAYAKMIYQISNELNNEL